MPETTDPVLALTSGSTWNDTARGAAPEVLTYAFQTVGLTSEEFTPDETVRASVREAFARWAAICGLSFVEVTDTGASGAAAIRILVADIPGGWAGLGGYPFFSSAPRMTLDTSLLTQSWLPGSGAFAVILHEIGHNLGLKHPFDGTWTLPASLDNKGNTIMSYTGIGSNPTNPAPYDILAVQSFYGTDASEQADGIDWTFDAATQRFSFTANNLANKIMASFAADRIQTFDGNDTVYGLRGNDLIEAGAGDDAANGDGGDDSIDAGAGDDRANGDGGNDYLYGGAGHDVLEGDGSGSSSSASLINEDWLYGDAGNDTLRGGQGNDVLFGGAGNDLLDGEGTAFFNFSSAHPFNDWLYGEDGDDSVWGGQGDDYLSGGEGNDVLEGDRTAVFYGGASFNDRLFGDNGNDSLIGGQGDDELTGGAGFDTLSGGFGTDTAVFAGPRSRYTVTFSSATQALTVVDSLLGGEWTDTVNSDVEQLRFSDGVRARSYFTTGLLAVSGGPVLAEGQSGSTAFTFTVTRTGNSSLSSSASWWVGGSGANPANAADFTGGVLPTGTVSFGFGQTTATVTVNVAGDANWEADEGFTLALYNGVNATIEQPFGNGIILNDEPVLSVAPLAADRAEGQSGSTAFTFTVTRTGSTASAVNASWSVTGDGANATDFVGNVLPSGSVSFAAGETSKTVTIQVVGDTALEADERFTLTLASPVGAFLGQASAVGVIRQDEPVLSIFATPAGRAEGQFGTTPFTFTIFRGGDASGTASVNWAATTGTASLADFAGGALPSGTVNFAAGETSRTLIVNIAADGTPEPAETFLVTIASPSGAFLGITSATGTIHNDDASAGHDVLAGEGGGDWFDGFAGDDLLDLDGLSTLGGNDTGLGGDGNDTVLGGGGQDVLIGGAGNDVLIGGADPDWVEGNGGSDWMELDALGASGLTSGNDTGLGGEGNDTIFAGAAQDVVLGGLGDDVIMAGPGRDWIEGGEGADWIEADDTWDIADPGGADTVLGGGGADLIRGGRSQDILLGEGGNDILEGGSGSDWLEGGEGDDWLEADSYWESSQGLGWDTLTGGGGNDTLVGGSGPDRFILNGWEMRSGERDMILDFNPWEGDRIVAPGSGVALVNRGDFTLLTTGWGYEMRIMGPDPAGARWGIDLW
jgi:Ca2+-binding RTX toxin-like protein